MNENNKYDLFNTWLASANLPYEILISVLDRYKDAETFYGFMIHNHDIPEDITDQPFLQTLRKHADSAWFSHMNELLTRHHIHTITLSDPDYPARLRDIADPPGILFWQGDLSCLSCERIVSIVGSRAATYSGLKATKTISMELSKKGVLVISGLAYGIDTEAHRGALEGNTPTVAVLGCGLDQTYPVQNTELRNQIIKHHGVILSEYVPLEKALSFHFPVRNRIISGLSDAIILMEAKIKSGSIITVDHALRQGREVFVYPGDPTSPLCEGNRSLLRDGGRFFTTALDILQDMNWLDISTVVGQNIDCSSPGVGSPLEADVIQHLLRGPLSFEQLLEKTNVSAATLLSTLTLMQMKQDIETLPGKRYQIKSGI